MRSARVAKGTIVTCALAVLLGAVVVGKVVLCMRTQSPVFVDEIAYADLSHEIAAHNRWTIRYPLPQSFPPWYSAVLAPWFALRRHWGMSGVYRAFLATNVVLAVCGCALVGMARWWRTWPERWWAMVAVLLWPPLSAYQHALLSENLCTPLYLLTMILLALTVETMADESGRGRTGWRGACGLGLALGVMYGVRPLTAVVAMVSAALALCASWRWRAIPMMALGMALGASAVMAPEYLWGKAEFFHYAGREHALIDVARRALRERDTGLEMLVRLGYAGLYCIVGTLILPWVGILCSYHRMPETWRVSLWYCAGCAGLMAMGSALHTMTSTHSVWMPRYLDPFMTGVTVLGLAGMMRMERMDRKRGVLCLAAGSLLYLLVPVENRWWMNALALAYMRFVAAIHPWALWCGWAALAGALAGVCVWWTAGQRVAAGVIVVGVLCVLQYLNAEEYGRHSRALCRLREACWRQIGARREVPLDQLATELHLRDRADIILMRQSVYFWSMGQNIFKMEPACHDCADEE